MEMKKKEVISRLKFWISVLEQEETPDQVNWEDFIHLMKISALSRRGDYMGKMYTPDDIRNIYVAMAYLAHIAQDGAAVNREDIIKAFEDFGVEKWDSFLVDMVLDYLTQFD